MAVGEPPEDAIVYVPHGLWMPALWEGLELPAAALELCLFATGLASRSVFIAGVIVVVVLVWHVVFRMEAENDPHSLKVSLSTRDISGWKELPAHSSNDTPPYNFPKRMMK